MPEPEIAELLATAANPMDAKHRLATEIVTLYHGADAAQNAGAEWRRIHSQGQLPTDAPEVIVAENPIGLVALIRQCGFAASNGDARRLIEQGGVSIDGGKCGDASASITITDGMEFKVGKKPRVIEDSLT